MPRNIAVGLGLADFPFETAAGFWRWVDLCDEGGVDSLWQNDRMLGSTPVLECVTAMAALAGRTRRIKFGMNVLSVALRDPVLVAKQCATIDMLSEGRLLPAFGIGSPLAPEWAMLGIDSKTRGKRTDEGLEIIRRLWSEDSVDFEGTHYHLKGASIAPKPVQRDIPLWIGGSSEAAIRRTGRIGTGWQAGLETPAEAGPVVAKIRAAAAEFGRVIDEDHFGASFPVHFGRPDDPALLRAQDSFRRYTGRDPSDYFVIDGEAMIVERVAAYVEAGVSKLVLRPTARGDDAMFAQTRRIIDTVLPAVAQRWPKPAKPATIG